MSPHRYIAHMRFLIILCLLSISTLLAAQVPSALSDPFTPGIERINLNPALGVHSPYAWDISLAGGYLHAQTDYAFLRSASLLTFVNRASEAQYVDRISLIPETAAVPLFIFDEDGGDKSAFVKGRILGPGITLSLDPDTKVGIFSQYRTEFSAARIPEAFGFYELNNSYATMIIDSDPATASFASWLEIGAHFSKQIDELSFGANIKILRANEGGYLSSNTDFTFPFVDSVLTTESQLNYDLGFTTEYIDGTGSPTSFNGGGIGIDIGANFITDFGNIGIAIHDIGALRFSTNVESYTSDILAGIEEIRTQDLREFTDIRGFLDNVQSQLDIEPDLFSVFSVGLPTRLTLQGEYTYSEDITIAAQINQRLPILPNSLQALNTVVITPTYTKGFFTAYVPVTIYEYSALRVGTAFRIGPLTIGTDHLTSVLFNHDFRGSDVFARLTITPFSVDGSGGGYKSRGNGKEVKCPIF